MVREVAMNDVHCLKWDRCAQWLKPPLGNLGTFILIRLRVSSLAKGHAVWRNGGLAGDGTRSAAASGAWEKQEHGKDNHGRGRGGGDDDRRSLSFTAASSWAHKASRGSTDWAEFE